MARKGKAVNKRKKPGTGRPPLLPLVLVAVLIALSLFFLERTRQAAPPAPVAPKAVPSQHLKLPPRPAPQQKISTASLPSAKPHVAVAPPATGTGTIAIIIDDMGTSQQELQSLLSIGLPLTFSVIPSLAHAKGVAQAAHKAGAEVMVHMPMEPRGYPKQPMEKIGLLVSMDNDQIEKRVEGYFGFVPFAVGANNHMGSRFTESAEKMEVVLKVLKQKGVFFVDSRTSPASIGYEKARALGLKCAARQVFLDNVQNEADIGRQLAEAASIAGKRGTAIAIGHPHPATIRALKAAMPQLARQGITFVTVSKLVK